MIYLVSRNKALFSPENYSQVDFDTALSILKPLTLVQLDTETEGLNCHSKGILTIQLGNRDNQVVFDWTTMLAEEKEAYKNFMESDKLFVGHNLMFDLTFMYKQGIYPKHIYDTMSDEDKLLIIKFNTKYHGDIILKHKVGNLAAQYDNLYALVWRVTRK